MRNKFAAAAILSACVLAAEGPRFETAVISSSHHAGGEAYSAQLEARPLQPVKLTMQNVTLKFCVQQAFSRNEYQVTGPGWISKARYDITAALAPAMAPDQVWQALQTLLAERFRLVMRREPKERLIYAMTIAKDGPKLHVANGDRSKGLKFQPGGRQGTRSRSGGDESGSLQLNNRSVAEFCDRLSTSANHPVVDKTGLAGVFDFDLQYSGTSSTAMSRALEKQLGLKLEPTKDVVEMLVVESALRKPL